MSTQDHPKPPFEAQTQPFPGHDTKMKPRADHGKTSYQGSGKLSGKKALITAGDSGIRRAVAIAGRAYWNTSLMSRRHGALG